MKKSISKIKNILFLDIETIPAWASFKTMPSAMKKHWEHKCKVKRWELPEVESEAEKYDLLYHSKSGIFAEFARIICISVGFISIKNEEVTGLRLKSFCNEDEKSLLLEFCQLLKEHYHNPNVHFLCGHNLREFDVPFICRRCLLNNVTLPAILDISGKRPWQTPQMLDTLEMWKFGDYKNYTSLDLLTSVFGIPSPKDDMDGSMVANVYWDEKDLDRIIQYCEKDVISVVQLYLRFNQYQLLKIDQIKTTSKYSIENSQDNV